MSGEDQDKMGDDKYDWEKDDSENWVKPVADHNDEYVDYANESESLDHDSSRSEVIYSEDDA